MIGEEGILEELQLAGFTGLGGPVIYFFPNKVYELMYYASYINCPMVLILRSN